MQNVKTIKYGMKSNVAIYERLTEMRAKSKLIPTKEAVKTFVNDSDVISFDGLTATSLETYNKKIKSNLTSRVRGR